MFSAVDDEKNMYDIYKVVKMVEQPMKPEIHGKELKLLNEICVIS